MRALAVRRRPARPPRGPRLAALVMVGVSVGVLASGCADAGDGADHDVEAEPDQPSNTPSNTPSSRPATGVSMAGDDYSYRAPEGWVDVTAEMRKSQDTIDTAVGERSLRGKVRDNFNSIVMEDAGTTLEQYEQIAPESLAFLAQDLEILPRVTIDGQPAAHVSGPAKGSGTPFFLEQYAVVVDDDFYTLTFAVERTLSEEGRRDLIDPVLASWTWEG